jgi:hypothetical protein
MLTFFVPPGIGDFSAMYSKLCNIDREMFIRPARDNPQRLSPFLDILPKVKNGYYAAHSSDTAVKQTLPAGTDLRLLPDGDYFLSINHWLEDGNSVADWVPGETSYHYELNIPEEQRLHAEKLLKTLGNAPRIGVYTSAYGNSRHWGFWGWKEWAEFLDGIIPRVPKETEFIFIGADYDLAISEVVHGGLLSKRVNSNYFVGLTEIGTTVELIKSFDYFFTFPSGLGFLADVVNTPHTMWFPQGLSKMTHTFTDPKTVYASHQLFESPQKAADNFESSGNLKQFHIRWQKSFFRNSHQNEQIPNEKAEV